MPDPLLYLKSIGIAAVVGALGVLAMAGFRRPAGATRLNCAGVLGLCLGILAGNVVMSLPANWVPVNALDRFLTIVVPICLVSELVAGFPRVPAGVAWFLRIGLALSIPGILLHGSVYLNFFDSAWTTWLIAIAPVASGVLLVGVWVLLFRLSRRSQQPEVSISLALAMSTQCAGLAIMLAGYIKGGAAAFPLAAALAATVLATASVSNRNVPTLLGPGVVNLFGVLFIGRYFGRLSTEIALTMLLAPLLCWVTEIPALRHRRPWIVGPVRLILVAIPLLIVLTLMKRSFDRNFAPLTSPTVPFGFPKPVESNSVYVLLDLRSSRHNELCPSKGSDPFRSRIESFTHTARRGSDPFDGQSRHNAMRNSHPHSILAGPADESI